MVGLFGCGEDSPADSDSGTGGVSTSGVSTSGGSTSRGGSTSGGAAGSGGQAGEAAAGAAGSGGDTGGAAGAAGAGGTAGTGGAISCGAATCTTGQLCEAGVCQYQLKQPIDRGAGRYVLEFPGTYFEVVPAGGRIVAFGPSSSKNLLTGTAQNSSNYGSTLWTSPQNAWGWPPPAAVDTASFTTAVVGNTITMASSQTPAKGPNVQLTKSFTPELRNGAILIEYTIKNLDNSAVSLAAWEVTRVFAGGIAYFPSGSVYAGSALSTTSLKSHEWYQSAAGTTGKKLFGDSGSGWVAHTDMTDLFVKQWLDVPIANQVANEGEVELYDGGTYLEVEVQGPKVTLAPNATTTFTVRWTTRPLGFTPALGDERLVSAVGAVLR